MQNLRLGDSQHAQLVKWHEGHVKQLRGMSDMQTREVSCLHKSLDYIALMSELSRDQDV